MIYDSTGTLVAKTLLAGGAIPLSDVVVRIYGGFEENRFVNYSILTDIDGITKALVLPAPNEKYSMAPFAKELPYSVYNLEFSKDGYYTKRIFNVAVFANQETIQTVNMIPLPDNAAVADFPRNNLSATVEENPFLEG